MAELWHREQEKRLKEVPAEYVTFWRAKLQSCRSGVLFMWGSLSFPPGNIFPGIALWITLHMLVAVITRMEGSFVYVVGNLVILTAIVYSCVHVAMRYCNLNPFPLWSEESDKRYLHVCQCFGYLQTLLVKGYHQMLACRKENAKMFYLVGFAVAFVLRIFGSLLSLGTTLHLTLSGVLLLPRAVESGWLSDNSLDVASYVFYRACEKGKNTANAVWLRIQRMVAEVTVGNRQTPCPG